MISLFSSVAIFLIVLCQCFHVFKLYKQLLIMEGLLNSILIKVTAESLLKEKKIVINQNVKRNFTRTDEQKIQASLKRKQWWERKRAEDAKKATQPVD